MRQCHVLEDHLPEDFRVAEPLHSVQDLDAGQTPFGVVVRRNTLSQVLGCDLRL